MTWDINAPEGLESDKIAALVIPYVRGRGLDLGCGQRKVWPHAIGMDNGHHFGRGAADIEGDVTNLSLFSDKSLDYVFSSHNLEHIVDYKGALKEWWRVIRNGGYLCLYLPHRNFYPNIGEKGANPDHKHDFMPENIVSAMKDIGSWEMLENEERSEGNEYSFYQVFKKTDKMDASGEPVHEMNIWQRNPSGQKRCLIIRYGAIGDQLTASSVLPGLKKQGYHITYNTTPAGQEVLLHDPHIDEWMLQDTDEVPNQQLGAYWKEIIKRYDKVVNLCESIEGALLALPGRLNHEYDDVARRKLCGAVNYLERTHDLAGVGYKFAQKFYMTDEEKEWIKTARTYEAPVILWAINGSSPHKVYPFVNVVIAWILKNTNVHVYLSAGAAIGVELQDAIMTTLKQDNINCDRVHPMGGKWTVREALTFSMHADCVVGPETGPLNAVAMEDIPKVIYLSHSSRENLTKHWKNAKVLTPPPAKCPCYPCHRLHYNWDNCHQEQQTAAALCASSITPQKLFETIIDALKERVPMVNKVA